MDPQVKQCLAFALLTLTMFSAVHGQVVTGAAGNGQTLFDLLLQSDQLLQNQQSQQQQQQQQQQQLPTNPLPFPQPQQPQYGGYSPTASNSYQAPFYAYQQPPWLMYYYLLENFV